MLIGLHYSCTCLAYFFRMEKIMSLKLSVGDVVELKKQHPCGGNSFTIMRAGMDFRIRCDTCGAQIWMDRTELEKRVRKIIPKE